MNCPVCDAKLRAVERMGVEIDICPDCKGVWLDKGELDKLIEFAAGDGPARRETTERPVYREEHRRDDDHQHNRDYNHEHAYQGKHKRKGSWLADVLGSFGGDD